MSERRFESRFMCADLVRVDWLIGEDDFRTCEAVLEDICAPGACVQVEEPIPVGATITISQGEAHFTGCVSYCVYRDYGYFVGIRLADESQWSSGAFAPQHLTNMQDLGLKSN